MEEVEDAYHEALLSVVSSVCREKPPTELSNVEAYLVRATKNRLIDAIRRRTSAARKHDGFAMDVALLREHDDDIPESQAIAGERSACFQLFLDYLRDGSNQEREPASDDASHRLFTEIQQQLAESLSDEHRIVLQAHGLHDRGFEACAALIGKSTGTAHNRWQEAVRLIRDAFLRHGIDLDGSAQ